MELAEACAQLADDKRAEDVLILDLRKLSSVCDYFVLCTGMSAKQLQAIADGLREQFKALELGKGNCEGYEAGAWILLEAGDVVVHLLRQEMRRFYDLESLWADAPVVPWKKRPAKRPATLHETGT
ncbi:MAG: ribosome silencing factor [Planctomycetes bacterium]|nr:ribosome silencing factor [Planctomycetota bacterium]